jgi:hypothetical protein
MAYTWWMRRVTQEAIECTNKYLDRMRGKGFSNQEILFVVVAEVCPEMLTFFDDLERTMAQISDRSDN